MSENKGDLISREALKKAYFNAIEKSSIGEVSIVNLIDNAPTVEPDITNDDLRACMKESHNLGYELAEIKFKRPQGEWINREAVSNTIFPFWERYECNQCHKFNGYSNFCPNCGAKMTGVTE